ncbi:MAG: M1 family metallopeptidase, partial [bacterium]
MKKRIRHLTTLLLAVALLLPLVSLAQDDLRLDPNVAPTFEAIELHLDARQTEYHGSVRIELQVKAATSSFRFHAEEMTLERVELQDARGAVVEVKTQAGTEGLIVATTGRELSPGAYTLAIDFSNDYNTRSVGLYRMEQDGVGYLFTQFEAVDAREAFPCWDEPNFKIPFQITIEIPEGQEAITNTPVASQTASNGTKTLVYHKTRPLPSYLLAIAAGPLESVPITGLSVPGRVYTVKGQKQLTVIATEITPPILTGLEKYFARPYPYAKLDLIAIPEYWPGAMENAGAVTFADNILLIDPRAASPAQRRTLAYVTAHELAHMWFGDLVTMKWWDDLWLNESFADWLGEKIANDLFPQYKISVGAVQNLQGLMKSDARPSTKPIKKTVVSAADIFEDLGLAYGKGKKVLGMVEQWIGPEVFRKGVIDYLGQHAWGNAEAVDLWGALSKVSGKDVAAPLLSFFTQPGYPMVSVAVESGGILKISQRRFLNFGVEAPALQWTVPLRLKYSNGKSVQTQTVLVDRATKSVRVGKNLAWVLPDGGAYGYYRWSIPKEMLFRLAQNPEKLLDERERVAFLGNASALLDAGAIGGDDYLTILGSFAKYPEPEIISAVLADLGRIRNAFIPDDLRTPFAYYVRETLRPALERFGL